MAQPELITERLRLRKLELSDEDAIFFLRSDDEVNKYLDSPRAKSLEDARAFINKINDLIAEDKSAYWAITRKEENKLIGTICFWNIIVKENKADIGYVLHPSCQGQGLMHEAVTAAIDYAFNNMRLQRIEATFDPDNFKSMALLKRHGFVFHNATENEVVYSLAKPVIKS